MPEQQSETGTEIKELAQQVKRLVDEIEQERTDEAAERDLQATKDSEQFEISKRAEVEKNQKDEATAKDQQAKHDAIVTSLAEISEKLNPPEQEEGATTDELLEALSGTNEKLETLIEYSANETVYQQNDQQLGTMMLSVAVIGVGAYLIMKFAGVIVSKLVRIIF